MNMPPPEYHQPREPRVVFSREATPEQARAEVKGIRNSLVEREEAPNSSEDQFLVLKEPSREIQEWHIVEHPWNEPGVSPKEIDRTAYYIQSLLKEAYPVADSDEMREVHEKFISYLQQTSPDGMWSGRLNGKELLNHIQNLHLVQLKKEALEAGQQEGALPFSQDQPEKIEESLCDFLVRKRVYPLLSQPIGEGCFGVVVSAVVQGEDGTEEEYAYKIEKRDVSKALTARNNFFWRESDCAATRLNNISDRARTLFFIFRIVQSDQSDQSEELHYVPAHHVKSFGMQVPSGATVFLEHQLMEMAQGENLHKIIQNGTTDLEPSKEHFSNIVRGLFHVIQEMQVHNLVHRDLKPENIFYDSVTGKVTLIDFGSAKRLQKKEKSDDISHRHRPTTTEMRGTPKYVSPNVLQQKPYGSEIDLFSFAMTILNLINPNEFEMVAHERFPEIQNGNLQDTLFVKCQPTKYLERFLGVLSGIESQRLSSSLKTAGPLGKFFLRSKRDSNLYSSKLKSTQQTNPHDSKTSQTEEALERHQELRTIIDLAFQASGGGTEGAEAYEQLKQLPYFNPKSSAVTMNDSTTSSIGNEETALDDSK
jgi:serine/threonine protein kinase